MIEMALAEPVRQEVVEKHVIIESVSDKECPDCHTIMTQYSDWDVLQFVCENCGTELARFSQGY